MAQTNDPHTERLTEAARCARKAYFAHENPGGLTPAELAAWKVEEVALHLMMIAAQTRLEAHIDLQELLSGAGE